MKISRPSTKKLSWLINHPSFRQKPIRILLKVIQWEIIRLTGRPTSTVYDKSLTILLYPNDGVARLVFYFGYHEPQEFHFLDRYLKPHMLCVDVGANIGTYSLFMAQRVSKVIAFEPQPETLNRLRESISVNHFSNIIVEQKAVANHTGKLELVAVGNDSAKTFTKSISDMERPPLVIDAVSLDEYFALYPLPRLDFLKIDVEGAELDVLHGACKTLGTFKPIIQIELAAEMQLRNGKSSNEVKDLLRSFGYEFYSIDNRINALREGTSWNTYAIHCESIPDLRRNGIVVE